MSDDHADEPPHDILAAEGFSVGGGDPALRHDPVAIPDAPFTEGDPVHDVLAAEEFAMPAGHDGAGSGAEDAGRGSGAFMKSARGRFAMAGGALGVAVAALMRRRR